MESINNNRITATKIIDRALSAADLANTDFLSYSDKVQYLNDAWKNVYQTIINYNLNVFTVEAKLIGSAGVYNLPFDCYQIKSVKNTITGVEILRKSDSQGIFGSYYEVVNNTIRLGPTVGPVTITYWRRPFFLSIPDKVVDTNIELGTRFVEDVCKDSVLLRNSADNKLWIYNLLTQSELEITLDDDYTSEENFRLGNNFIIWLYEDNGVQMFDVFDFKDNVLINEQIAPSEFIRADNGLLYPGVTDITNKVVNIYTFLNASEPLATISYDEGEVYDIVCIENEFYKIPTYFENQKERAMPIGIFDNMPAYGYNNKLNLITPKGDIIENEVDVPTIGPTANTRYGFLTFDGNLYSNVPDTELNFPNNLYYDVLSYDLAIRFLCKQNADSSGCENLNKNAWSLLTASIDQSADFCRIKNVRR